MMNGSLTTTFGKIASECARGGRTTRAAGERRCMARRSRRQYRRAPPNSRLKQTRASLSHSPRCLAVVRWADRGNATSNVTQTIAVGVMVLSALPAGVVLAKHHLGRATSAARA